MTEEEKQLVFIDLCARLPYGVKVENTSFLEPQIQTLFGRGPHDEFWMLETYNSVGGEDYRRVTDGVHYTGYLERIKPFLRPMSSMTEEEREEYKALQGFYCYYDALGTHYRYYDTIKSIDYLYSIHVDLPERDMIGRGLALEAPDGMYKTE